ncbi:MAG: type II toxin-antitoxin system VapC family toxin [Parvibaculum sp.]|uniref:type II toxin-antitoxin system VapC family toxin n=1 Tax=Parvibaculum sp. TaxID=2024848 RepID=UPI002AB87CA7|nr:type II toxin-antitoxin system VapC family toxin [Parvibaculum sp.]MDZ4379750.1 type II toxin-antitoxin system VapC family toxin [Parvibaculum sp.]
MRFLFDTNAVIALLKGHEGFLGRLHGYRPDDFGLPSIVAHELYYGAHKGQRVAANLARIEALRFEVVEFDREDARKAGELRASLAASGTPIGPYDVLIAGQALARGLVLITHNMREFRRVPDLAIEDWE